MAYIGSSPTKVVSRQSANIFTYTATANQTAFTGADANGNTLACSPSDLMVHMNGIKLEESDYTATTTTVTLVSGAAAGDEVTITAFLTFESADHYTKSAADTRYVNTTGDTMSGDLTIDTDTFHVDVADNRVGIGTASPAYQLDLQGGATTNERIRLLRGTDDTNQFMTLGYNHISTNRANVALASAQTGLSFKQVGSDGTRTVMDIDSAGRITTPYQPAFRAYDNETVTNNGVIVFDSVNQRGGTNYSTSNGRFTCPVAGWYHFHFKYLTVSGGTRNDCSFYKNGSVYVEQRNYKDSGNHESYDLVAVDYFNANDYITCNIVYGDVYNFTTWSSWYGYLIG